MILRENSVAKHTWMHINLYGLSLVICHHLNQSVSLQVEVSVDAVCLHVHCVWSVFSRAVDDCLQMAQAEICPPRGASKSFDLFSWTWRL